MATCALKWSSLSWAQSYSATAQASSTPSSPELTPQVRELLPWIPQGRGNHVTSTKLRLLFLSCSVFFPFRGNTFLQTYFILSGISQQMLRPDFEMKSMFLFHVTISWTGITCVEGGGCDGMSMKADSLLKRGCVVAQKRKTIFCATMKPPFPLLRLIRCIVVGTSLC